MPPLLDQVIIRVFSQSAVPLMLSAYTAGEVDMILLTGQAALGRVKSDPVLSRELHSMVNFVTFYMTMDTYNPPFDDLRVRRAFAHSIDRTALMDSALKDVGVAAYSMLAPGFPGAKPEVFRDMLPYDPERARQLMAEAGYPDGKGFPQVDIWIRAHDYQSTRLPAEAIQAMIAGSAECTGRGQSHRTQGVHRRPKQPRGDAGPGGLQPGLPRSGQSARALAVQGAPRWHGRHLRTADSRGQRVHGATR